MCGLPNSAAGCQNATKATRYNPELGAARDIQ